VNRTRWSFYAIAAALAATAATAAPLLDQDVFCNGVKCGNMKINEYSPYENVVNGRQGGGVTIDGVWTPTKPRLYHYLQAIVRDDAPIPFVDGTALPQPYVDTPPGGYQNQPFDWEPYYDEGNEFPDFFDMPRTSSRRFDNLVGPPPFNLSTFFETWVVCVIEERFGADPKKAKDDSYKVAPLFGFTWGYTYTWVGGDLNDEKSFTVTPSKLTPIKGKGDGGPGPSAQWLAALGQNYGMGANADRFNVEIGSCVDCLVIPEPGSLGTAGIVTFAVLIFVRRGRRNARQTTRYKSAHID
jgi:hypothetical protein